MPYVCMPRSGSSEAFCMATTPLTPTHGVTTEPGEPNNYPRTTAITTAKLLLNLRGEVRPLKTSFPWLFKPLLRGFLARFLGLAGLHG